MSSCKNSIRIQLDLELEEVTGRALELVMEQIRELEQETAKVLVQALVQVRELGLELEQVLAMGRVLVLEQVLELELVREQEVEQEPGRALELVS